ncbi:hypothetical protein D3C86_1999830 [compost metagenome]
MLKGDNEKNRETIDSTVIKNGNFQFKGNTEMPEVYMVRVFPTQDRSFFTEKMELIARPSIPMLIDKGTVQICVFRAKWPPYSAFKLTPNSAPN